MSNREQADGSGDWNGADARVSETISAKKRYGAVDERLQAADEVDKSDENDGMDGVNREDGPLEQSGGSMSWAKRPSVLLISLVLFAFTLADSSGTPSRSTIMYQLSCNRVAEASNTKTCNRVDAQEWMSNYALVTSVLIGLVTMAVSTNIGQYSDNYGRRRFLGLFIVLKLVGRIFQYWVSHLYPTLQFGLMVASEILGSLCGSVITLTALSNSYISDVVGPHDRMYSMDLGVAACFSGTTFGPVIADRLISASQKLNQKATSGLTHTKPIAASEFVPLKFEIVILAVLSVYTMFGLPESRSKHTMSKSRSISAGNIRDGSQSGNSFLKPLRLLTLPPEVNPQPWRTRAAVLSLILIETILAASMLSLNPIFLQFGIYKLNWSSTDIAHMITMVSLSQAFVLVVVSPCLLKTFKGPLKFKTLTTQMDMIDFGTILLGLVVMAICFLAMGLSQTNLHFLASLTLSTIGSLADPSLNSTIVKFFPEANIGKLFGALALLKNCFALVGPFIFQYIYKQSLSKLDMPGLVFLVFAVLTCIGSVVLILDKSLLKLNSKSIDDGGNSSSDSNLDI